MIKAIVQAQTSTVSEKVKIAAIYDPDARSIIVCCNDAETAGVIDLLRLAANSLEADNGI